MSINCLKFIHIFYKFWCLYKVFVIKFICYSCNFCGEYNVNRRWRNRGPPDLISCVLDPISGRRNCRILKLLGRATSDCAKTFDPFLLFADMWIRLWSTSVWKKTKKQLSSVTGQTCSLLVCQGLLQSVPIPHVAHFGVKVKFMLLLKMLV